MKYFLCFLLLSLTSLYSCSRSFQRDRSKFESSAVIKKYTAIGDMNDSYFEIRENNFFQFYMQLFDSVKNTSYPGRYTQKGDTLYLNFYDKKGIDILGSKALINERKKEIVFFDHFPGIRKTMLF